MALPKGRAYGSVVGNTPFRDGDFYINSSQNTVTATASGGRANAYPIVSQTIRITTVATAGDSIQLPLSDGGLNITVINAGANAMQVFANVNTSDTINGIAAATGVSQLPGSIVVYSCPQSGSWYTQGLGQAFNSATGLPLQGTATVAANVTGTQASGVAIVAQVNNVTSAGSAYSVTLPVSAPGMSITILTTTATNTVAVFPNAAGTTTETINALSANAGITMAARTSATFYCVTAGQWYTLPRVPS